MTKELDQQQLIDRYIGSMTDDEALVIMGIGSFTKNKLREELENRTSVGVQVIQMILEAELRSENATKCP